MSVFFILLPLFSSYGSATNQNDTVSPDFLNPTNYYLITTSPLHPEPGTDIKKNVCNVLNKNIIKYGRKSRENKVRERKSK